MTLSRRTLLHLSATAAFLPLSRVSAQERTTLSVSHGFEGPLAAVVQEFESSFERQASATDVEYFAGGDSWDSCLQATLRSAIVGTLPDLSHQSLTYTSQFVARGMAMPLEDIAGGADVMTDLRISEALARSVRHDGKIFGVPLGTTLPVIYYNRDLLGRVGYDADRLPSTWDEIVQLGRAISDLQDGHSGLYMEYSANNAWMFQNLLASFGGRMMSDDESEVQFDSAAGLAAMEVLHTLGSASKHDMTKNQARQSFNEGGLGILIRSASGIPAVERAVGDKFRLGIGSFPVPAPAGHLVGAGHGVVAFTEDEDKYDAALAYLTFLTGEEGQYIMARHTGYMPTSAGLLENDSFRGRYLTMNPHHRELVKILPGASDWYSFPRNTVKIFDGMTEHLRQVFVRETAPDQALQAMAREVRQGLSQS